MFQEEVMFMAEYNEAIKRPFLDWMKFGIGALMYMIPMVNIVTNFFGTGYMLKCAKTATRKSYALPDWENWGQLFVQGLLATIIAVVYSLPAIIVGFIIGGSTFSQLMMGFTPLALLRSLTGSMFIVGLLLLLALYILPAGFIIYATRDNFSSAFDFQIIFRRAFTAQYFTAWIVSVAYSLIVLFVAGFISTLLAITLILPFVVAGCAAFMMGVTAATIFGEAWGETKEI